MRQTNKFSALAFEMGISTRSIFSQFASD